MEITILLDYDNLPRRTKSLGLSYVSDKCLRLAGAVSSQDITRAKLKVYGGWYESNALTKRAQLVSMDIVGNFPYPLEIDISTEKRCKAIVSAELAYSLEIFPTKHLFNTYRKQSAPTDIKCRDPLAVGCSEDTCQLKQLRAIFQSGKCPNPSCSFDLSKFLYRGAQKLVDSMMVVDMLYLVSIGHKYICVVTSDDDFWPAIMTSVLQGCDVIHVHPKNGRRTYPSYHVVSGGRYCEFDL